MNDNEAKNSCVLAIDLGTSGPKSALVTMQGKVLDTSFQEVPTNLLPGGGAEQSPASWWEAVKGSCLQVLNKNPQLRDSVAAVCCTAQWSGTVALDKEGRALQEAIIWLDTRGSPYIGEVFSGAINIQGYSPLKLWKWLRQTGGIPSHSGKDSIAHILFIKHALPHIYEQTAIFLEPKDYINYMLTGRTAASTDSITLHWLTDTRRLENIDYSESLLKSAGIERSKLPELKRAVDVLGQIKTGVAEELGLKKDVQVIMGTPDIHSAILGSGAVLDHQPHLYIGTSSWLTCHVPYKKTDVFRNMASLPASVPNRYFIANEQETAGACLNFIKSILMDGGKNGSKQLPDSQAYPELDRMAETSPAGSNGIIFTPWLYGERTPVEDETLRGGFANLTLASSREDLVRAVLEGVAYNSRWLLEAVEKFARHSFTTINFIGGGAKSNIWGQIHADVLNRKIRKVADPMSANVRGAAFLAALSLNAVSLNDIPALTEIEQEFEPEKRNRHLYDEFFKEFLSFYKNTKKIYSRLNRKENSYGRFHERD